MDSFYILDQQDIHLDDFPCGAGFILDIGAGGEGIIGRLKGAQVVGIDRHPGELMGTSNDSLKVVMDATDLKFLDNSFETATVFYGFMYMPWESVEKTLSEIHRVLRPGGQLLIWDAVVQPPAGTDKKAFLAHVSVTFPDGSIVHTGYGAHLRTQAPEDFTSKCRPLFDVQDLTINGSGLFMRCLRKQ